jgi:EmrB/QacA subfamily drug resistance transporter
VAQEDQVARRRWFALLTLCLCITVIGVDNTILNVALPTLVRDLNATTSDLQWIVDAYILVFAGLLLTAGSLGDRFGRKGALMIGLVLFAVASASAAFSGGVTQLIISRAFMGIGAAFIMPATLSIITNIFTDPKERGRAIGIWAGVSGIGIGLGPIIGGVLLAHFWWGSVFLVNVPIVCVALVLCAVFVPTSRDPSTPRLDPVGALLSMIGLSLLLWTIIQAPERGWGSAATIGGFLASIAVIGAFAYWEMHRDQPMLDLTFFKNPRFTVANVAVTMAFFAIAGAVFIVTQMLQFILGFDPLEAGIGLLPVAIMFMVFAPIAPRIVERFGSKRLVGFGLVGGAFGLLILSTVRADSSYIHIALGLTCMSGGMSMAMPSATESIMGSVPKEKAGVGSAMNDTTRQAGGALGVAVLGSVLASGFTSELSRRLPRLQLTGSGVARTKQSIGAAIAYADHLGGKAGATLATVARESWMHGASLALLIGSVFVFGGAALAFALLPARATHHHLNATELLPIPIVIDDDQLSARDPEPALE